MSVQINRIGITAVDIMRPPPISAVTTVIHHIMPTGRSGVFSRIGGVTPTIAEDQDRAGIFQTRIFNVFPQIVTIIDRSGNRLYAQYDIIETIRETPGY